VIVNTFETQLSQRGRTMLRVIEYFAKSLKVVRNDTLESGADPGICVRGAVVPPLPLFLSLPPPSFLLPSLPSLPFPSLTPVLSSPISFPSLPSPSLRSRPPVLRLGGLGERSSSPSGSGRSPAAKRFLVNCRLKIVPVVAMVTKDTST